MEKDVLPQTALTDLAAQLDRELADTIFRFEDIQADLNYKQAKTALREMVNQLDLSPQEREGLETELHSLDFMLDKLDRQVVQIAVFGMVGRGKSSLLNALLGQPIFETGAIHGVTINVQSANWEMTQEAIAGSSRKLTRVSLQGSGNSQIELIDTPGIDEVDGESREIMARSLAKQADLILFVVAGDMTKVEFEALSELRKASKPMLLVFNKIDQYPQADRVAIYQKIRDDRVKELLSPDEIVMAAASPLIARAVRTDGKVVAQLSPGTPQVEELKLKILEILHREGKSLVALNTMLYADDVNEQIVQRKMEIRDRAANKLIGNAAITKAVTVALNPLTVIDVFSGAIIDIALILTLSKLYGISMTQQGAIELLKNIAIGMGGVTVSELVAVFSLGSLKSFLGAAAPATGGVSLAPYLSVALAQAGVAGVTSTAIGQVTKAYLANGATWGPDGPKAVVSQILATLDKDSILSRIKDELRAKLSQRWEGESAKE